MRCSCGHEFEPDIQYKHFVICGDCREPETWTRLLGAAGIEKVNGVFTSPPYAEQRKKQYGGVPTDEYVEWWEAVQANVRANLAEDGSFFVNIKPHCKDGQRVLYVFDLVLAMARRWGWRFVDELCWIHTGYPGDLPGRFKNGWESIYHFATCTGRNLRHRPGNVLLELTSGHYKHLKNKVQGKAMYQKGYEHPGAQSGMGNFFYYKNLNGSRPCNVIEANMGNSLQAAAFPVKLPDFFIRAYSDEGDVWVDPFCGSGTTIVAAHNNDRRALGIERLEKYVAVILERLSGLGLTSKLIE